MTNSDVLQIILDISALSHWQEVAVSTVERMTGIKMQIGVHRAKLQLTVILLHVALNKKNFDKTP